MATALDQMVTIAGEVASAIDAATLSIAISSTAVANAGHWAEGATVVRTYFPQYDLDDLATVRCTVVPASYAVESVGRRVKQETFGVDVVLQQKDNEDSERDALMTLSGEITEQLENSTLPTSGAVCIAVEDSTVFDLDMLEQLNVLASGTRYLYRAIRSTS